MKHIKLFDVFPKYSIDTLTHSTIVGALLSLTSITMMIFLTIKEVINYLKPVIKTDALIIQDSGKDTLISFNLSLLFNNLPCNIISLDLEDSKEKHLKDINETVHKERVLKNDTLLPFAYQKQRSIERFIDALKEEEGCLLRGFVDIPKAPGNVHISFHPYGHIWNALRNEPDEVRRKFRLSHKFNLLHFGAVDVQVLKRFGMNLNTFDRLEHLPNYLNGEQLENYEYYLKIIPYLLEDKARSSKHLFYQYSLLHKPMEYDQQRDKMPYVILHYDYSPITMRLLLFHIPFSHFLTKVCAIIGGIFVVFSLLNQMLSAYSATAPTSKG